MKNKLKHLSERSKAQRSQLLTLIERVIVPAAPLTAQSDVLTMNMEMLFTLTLLYVYAHISVIYIFTVFMCTSHYCHTRRTTNLELWCIWPDLNIWNVEVRKNKSSGFAINIAAVTICHAVCYSLLVRPQLLPYFSVGFECSREFESQKSDLVPGGWATVGWPSIFQMWPTFAFIQQHAQ